MYGCIVFVSDICNLLSHHHRNVPTTWSDTPQQNKTTNYSNSKTYCTEHRMQQTYFIWNIEQARPMGVYDVPTQVAKSSFNHQIGRWHRWHIVLIILSQLAQVRCDVNRGSPAYSISAYTPSTLYIFSRRCIQCFDRAFPLCKMHICNCVLVGWFLPICSKEWACRESAT